MKVLQIVYSGLGGVGAVAFSLVEASLNNSKKKNNHFFLFRGKEKIYKGYVDSCMKLGIKYENIMLTDSFLSRVFETLKYLKIVINQKPNIIISHDCNVFFLFLLKIFYSFKIIYVHHTPDLTKRYIDWVNFFISIFFSNIIILVSKRPRHNFISKINKLFFQNKMFVVQNGINFNKYKNNNKFNLKKKNFNFGMAARFVDDKYQIKIIDIIKKNHEFYIDKKIKFYLAGSGENLPKIKNYVAKNKLTKYIIFSGALNEKETIKWFKKLDFYIHLSRDETSSTSILQALSMSLPVIASNNFGNQNLRKKIANNYNLILTDNNIDIIHKNIFILINNLKKIKKLRVNSRKSIIKYFNYIKMFNSYKKFFYN